MGGSAECLLLEGVSSRFPFHELVVYLSFFVETNSTSSLPRQISPKLRSNVLWMLPLNDRQAMSRTHTILAFPYTKTTYI